MKRLDNSIETKNIFCNDQFTDDVCKTSVKSTSVSDAFDDIFVGFDLTATAVDILLCSESFSIFLLKRRHFSHQDPRAVRHHHFVRYFGTAKNRQYYLFNLIYNCL